MVWQNKVSTVGAGFYSVPLDNPDNDKWRTLIATDYVNTVFCWNTDKLAELAAHNTKAWYSVYHIFAKVRDGVDGWETEFDALYEGVKNSGYADTVLGWYIDEPSDMAAVKTLTKYAAEHYGKRFLICFMVNTVDYNVWGGYKDENSHLNRDNVQYLTDIAVDHYWPVNDETKPSFERLYGTLHEVMPSGCRVWYIPNNFTSRDRVRASAEEIAAAQAERIVHTRYMYEWLKKEPPENRGGILFFAYDFDSDYENLYGMWNFNQHTNNAWAELAAECETIGREICTDTAWH